MGTQIICFTILPLARQRSGISTTTFTSAALLVQLFQPTGAWSGREFRLARILEGRAGLVASLLTLIRSGAVGFIDWLDAGFDDLPGLAPEKSVRPIRLSFAAPRPDRCKPAPNSLRFYKLGLQSLHERVKATQRLDRQMQPLHLGSQTA